jgi:hypothetical protein
VRDKVAGKLFQKEGKANAALLGLITLHPMEKYWET